MFGIIPRPLWERTNPPDERNRIRLALRPLLIRTGTANVLVDTGIGDKWDEKSRDIYRIEKTATLADSLARLGLAPEDITHVVLTHLHFDHAGGTTGLDPRNQPRPCFPRARHFVQAVEWEDATHPNRRTRGAYLPENFLPLEQAGLLELVTGTQELLPGVELLHAGGHTRGLMLVRIRAEGRTAIYWSDLIPTTSHIATPYIMGYDLFPLQTMEQKERLIDQACDEGWLSFFAHDPLHAGGRITRRDDSFGIEPFSFRNGD
uniref:MBL fold metallo-hydrolase n=1 Tax=candidate division WOR-3 bacterium TaxID=2052148 RepID=A0A7C4CDK5_UNCW3